MKLAVFILSCLLAYAVDLVDSVPNGFKTRDRDPKSISVSVIDLETAKKLFKEFVQDKEIPFKYPLDGCYARATAMSQIAEKEHVLMARVYAEGSLQVITDLPSYRTVRWGWHVAPVAFVKDKNGKPTVMVFDPALFKEPVTVDQWTKKMLDKSGGFPAEVTSVYYGDRFQYDNREKETYKATQLRRDMVDMRRTMATYSRFQDLRETSSAESTSAEKARGTQ